MNVQTQEKTAKTGAEYVTLVEERIKDGEDLPTRRQMMINLNYYLGNQWIYFDNSSKMVKLAPPEDGVERITHNVIKPRVMVKLAKQTKNRLKYDVIPDTNDDDRIEIAKVGTKFLRHWWNEEEMDRKTRDIFLNNGVKGYCAAKVYFDPQAGQDITPQTDMDGMEMMLDPQQRLFTGEIRCRICDPLTLYIDPSATSDDEIRWMIEEKPRDVSYVEQKYGKKVAPDENVALLSSYDASTQNMGTEQKKTKNMVMVREMWVAPCPEYPNGLKVTTTRNDFLDADDNAGEIPYIIFGDIPIPGSVKYDAFIKDMLPIQRKINYIQSMMATHAKRMGNSKWFIPLGAGVDEEDLDNEIGGFVYYNAAAGGRPEREEPPNLPNFYDRILEYANRDIDDMSGAREIAQGRLPSGLDTASGLSLMVEQENEKLAVTSQNYERGMKKLLKRVLVLMKKHYTEERMGRILGADNEVEIVSFRGADLSGGEDIDIVQGSSLPEMRSAQEDRIMTLWNSGLITRKDGTPDTDGALRLLGMGDSSELYEQRQLDENKAKMENKIFKNLLQVPQPPIVRDFQDHEIHIYYHDNFRKSSEYDELPPELQQIVDAHVEEHKLYVQQALMAQLAAQTPPENGVSTSE